MGIPNRRKELTIHKYFHPKIIDKKNTIKDAANIWHNKTVLFDSFFIEGNIPLPYHIL